MTPDQLLADSRSSIASAVRHVRQLLVSWWVVQCWGWSVLQNTAERGGRLVEEALECGQAVGLPREKAQAILDHVYSRPAGDPAQEVGGVSVTLLALCASLGLDPDDCELAEIERVLAKPVEHFRRRHAEKEAAGVMVTTQEHAPATLARPLCAAAPDPSTPESEA